MKKQTDNLIQLKETYLVPDGEPFDVVFGPGRLGVQIADVNGKVLVSCFGRISCCSIIIDDKILNKLVYRG